MSLPGRRALARIFATAIVASTVTLAVANHVPTGDDGPAADDEPVAAAPLGDRRDPQLDADTRALMDELAGARLGRTAPTADEDVIEEVRRLWRAYLEDDRIESSSVLGLEMAVQGAGNWLFHALGADPYVEVRERVLDALGRLYRLANTPPPAKKNVRKKRAKVTAFTENAVNAGSTRPTDRAENPEMAVVREKSLNQLYKEALAPVLYALRDEAGLPTQTVVGNAVGVTANKVSGWETGQAAPNPQHRFALEEFYSEWLGRPIDLSPGAFARGEWS